jgi:hypothetical protein
MGGGFALGAKHSDLSTSLLGLTRQSMMKCRKLHP